MNTTYSQLIRAHRLASAHGHAWANVVHVPESGHPLGEGEIDINDLAGMPTTDAASKIAAASLDACPHWPGITTPYWDADGDISHETGTGRLSWLVQADGTTTISVRRPGEVEACSACLSPAGEIVRVAVDADTCLIRHAEALADALSDAGDLDLADLKLTALASVYEAAITNSRQGVACMAASLWAEAREVFHRLGELADASDESIDIKSLTPAMMTWLQAEFGSAD